MKRIKYPCGNWTNRTLKPIDSEESHEPICEECTNKYSITLFGIIIVLLVVIL